MPRAWLVVAVSLITGTGCAGTLHESRLASAGEAMCKHCNCLMPAGVDPETTCPVCTCGKRAAHCVRGR